MNVVSSTPAFTLSRQQQIIHDEFERGTGNVVIIARAGVGKTTTAVTGVAKAPEKKVLFCAFNNRIAKEGNDKLAKLGVTNAQFKTMHSTGFAAVMRFWEGVRISENFERQNNLTNAVCGGTAPDAIKKLVSKLHTLGREIAPHATRGAELYDLAIQFECAPDEQWDGTAWDLNYVCTKAAEAMALAASVKPADKMIDFSDMIFLPVRNKWLTKQYDMVVIDEAQDLTIAQLEIAQGVCRGRIFVVGDDKQAIYGFRGADSNSLSRLCDALNAKELKLTQTFRCGKKIVAEAQRFVPDFEAAEANHDGSIESLPISKLVETAAAGDFILSRVNAPLVSIAMRLLRQGKRTRIAGRDIGKGLVALVRKLKGRSVPDMLSKISAWQTKELKRLEAKYAPDKLDSPAYTHRCDAINDQAAMLSEITESCKGVAEVEGKIVALFTDDGLGDAGVITCSSVHKSKGLEASRVFVLADTLRHSTGDPEEQNIAYVAVTRAIHTLVYVTGL